MRNGSSLAYHPTRVVIATFHSADDKSKVINSKANLKNDRACYNVYINHDISLEERHTANNLRTIVDAVNRGERGLSMHGSRVVSRRQHSDRQQETDNRHSTPNDNDHHAASGIRQSSERSTANNSSNNNNRGGGRTQGRGSRTYRGGRN